MKYTFIVSAVFAGLAVAQLDLPACAQQCVVEMTSGGTLGGCPLTDPKCICEAGGFLASIACCLTLKCNAADLAKAPIEAANFCRNAAKVTGLPTAVVCNSSSTGTSSMAPTVTGTPSGSITSAPATTGSSLSNAVSSISSVIASGVSAASTSSRPTSTPNAAAHNVAGVGAGVLAIAAALL